MEGKGRKIILIIATLGFCLLLVVGLIKFGSLLAFLMIFPWIVDKLVNAGFDIWLARLITVPLACIMVLGIGLAFSISSQRRNTGLAIFAAGLMLWSAAMFAMSKDYIFDPISGKSRKCYAITPDGYETVPCVWKVHPVYGSPVQKPSREALAADWVIKNGLHRMRKIEPERDLRFFAQDGAPLVWYYQGPEGKFELFSQPGRHPQLNVPLKPVDASVVGRILKSMDDASDDKSAVRFDGLHKLKKTLQETRIKQ
ncbi:MAG: hypothetical protein JW925_12155 [Syntrophaceae bacterium]|nr:hypothetical protein [Syntrophaceae bacterium]